MKKTNKWLVTVKSGHVGKTKYIPVVYPIVAETGKEAAKIGRQLPRAKHHASDCILEVRNVTDEEYLLVKLSNENDPYLKCKNHQQQMAHMEEIIGRIVYNDEPKKYRSHRHSLRRCWNDAFDLKNKNIQAIDFALVA